MVFKDEHLRDDGVIQVGFQDVFGRYHWAPRKSVRAVVKSIREKWLKSKEEASQHVADIGTQGCRQSYRHRHADRVVEQEHLGNSDDFRTTR